MIESAFSTPIFVTSLTDINNEKIEEYAYDLKNKSEGCKLSNIGGWQSNNVLQNNLFYSLKEKIEKCAYEFYNSLGYKKNIVYEIQELWININSIGNLNHPHVHPGSVISGVYFIKCIPQKSGKIIFINPHAYNFNEHDIDFYTPFNSGKHYHYPVKNKLLLFQPWISHYVEPNSSSTDRISISFNMRATTNGKN